METGADVRVDWATQVEELYCPLCRYNLCGLVEARCPECGYRFSWRELRDPALRQHPYLFEHHPERKVWAFVATLWHGLRPGVFWRDLHPVQKSRPGMLALYAGVVGLVVMVTLAGLSARPVIARAADVVRQRQLMQAAWTANPPPEIIRAYGSVQAAIDASLPAPWTTGFFQQHMRYDQVLKYGGALIVWPIALFLTLQIFKQTMGQAGVRPVHVARCVIYGADTLLLLCAVAVVVCGVECWYGPARSWPAPQALLGITWRRGGLDDAATAVMVYGMVGWLVLFTWRMIKAYRLYLRFPHAAATIVLSQVVVGLAWLVWVVKS